MNPVSNLSNTLNSFQYKYKHLINYQVSKLTIDLTKLLFQESLIRGFFIGVTLKYYFLTILLKYGSNKNVFKKLYFLSKPIYKNKSTFKFKNGLGLLIVSTTKGIMTNYNATKLKLGGILLMQLF